MFWFPFSVKSILWWLLSKLILQWRITRLARWHRSRSSIWLSWHILVERSGLTLLLRWHKAGLRSTILRRCHIWVWIHSTWLSIWWLRRHHARLNCAILTLWDIRIIIHSSRLTVIWLGWRYIVLIHTRLSKVLRITHIRIILLLRGFIVMMFCHYYFFFNNFFRVFGFSSISVNHAADDENNAKQNNYCY